MYLTRPKKPQPPKVGSVLSLCTGSRYGLLVAVKPWDEGPRGTHVLHARYISPYTGRPMTCPDSRCDHPSGCVICGHTLVFPRQQEDFSVYPDYDLAFYAASGMLDPELAAAASIGGKLVELDAKDARIAAEFKAEYGGKRDR